MKYLRRRVFLASIFSIFGAYSQAESIPVNGQFETAFGNSLPFTGWVHVHDQNSGGVELTIGDPTGQGMVQTFAYDGFFNNSSAGGLDFALLYGWEQTPRGNIVGGIIDVDAIGLYDDEPGHQLVDLRLTVWDRGDNFNGHWEWDSGRFVPEPSGLLQIVLAVLGLYLHPRKRQ